MQDGLKHPPTGTQVEPIIPPLPAELWPLLREDWLGSIALTWVERGIARDNDAKKQTRAWLELLMFPGRSCDKIAAAKPLLHKVVFAAMAA